MRTTKRRRKVERYRVQYSSVENRIHACMHAFLLRHVSLTAHTRNNITLFMDDKSTYD